MIKPLIYIDQNVIGMLLDGKIKLTAAPDLYWVYSKEHFAEIRRSSNPNDYLLALESIDAKLLEVEFDSNWKLTGHAQLIERGTPLQHYQAYIEATNEVDFDGNVFDPFQAWLNGGGNENALQEFPVKITEQICNLTKGLPEGYAILLNSLNEKDTKFDRFTDQLIEQGNDISKARTAMGDGKGAIGGIQGDNQILQIWDILRATCPSTSCDQFFGFEPYDKQGYEHWPIYLGILGCCAVMDIIGFQSEKKCRNIEKIPNIRSDAGHIAMAAFCSAILSEDKRLIKRAKAIYEYKNIPTIALPIKGQENSE